MYLCVCARVCFTYPGRHRMFVCICVCIVTNVYAPVAIHGKRLRSSGGCAGARVCGAGAEQQQARREREPRRGGHGGWWGRVVSGGAGGLQEGGDGGGG